MIRDENQYWPFEVLGPGRRSEQHCREIDFLESAHGEGFRPYAFGPGNFGATRGGRGGVILVRGRGRWEVILGTADETLTSAHHDDFDEAAGMVLLWLRGGEGGEATDQVAASTPASLS